MTTGASKEASSFGFYAVDLDTATAVPINENVERGGDEATSPAYYSSYLSATDRNGTTVYRLGYQEVTTAEGPGLGVTQLLSGARGGQAAEEGWAANAAAAASATTALAMPSAFSSSSSSSTAWEAVPIVDGLELFYSLCRVTGQETFFSLAPSTASNHTLSVVQWTRGGDAQVVLDLSNAHPPGSSLVGPLGYVADTASASAYAAIVVKKGVTTVADEWEVVYLEATEGGEFSGGASVLTGSNFAPLGAETVTVSGVGLKA